MRRLFPLLLLLPAAAFADDEPPKPSAAPRPGTPAALAQNPKVQKELGLTAEEQAAVGKLNAADGDEKLPGIVKGARLTRLKQLSLQARGGAAIATDPGLTADLKLTDGQRGEVAKIWKNKELDLEMRLKVIRFRNAAVREAWILNARKEHGEAVVAALTGEQKKAFTEMQGKPFDFGDKK